MKFAITKRSATGNGRCGVLELAHGAMTTPAFMPVGTAATVKALYPRRVGEMGYRTILANSYHLYLRPGVDIIKSFSGLHKFCDWPGNILTDSGGFQIFSLAKLSKVEPDGVSFRSHIDGSRHYLTPGEVIELQQGFNSDIAMALDVCTPYAIEQARAEKAMAVTHRWAVACKERWLRLREESGWQGELFAIVQGNFFKSLRRRSADFISRLELPGIAIGGLSVGEPADVFFDYLNYTAELLPTERPRYVMGIGSPDYIFQAVEAGIDMFDCVLPTRMARNSAVFTLDGAISLKKSQYKYQHEPIESECRCLACSAYSRAYLHHLFKAGEIFAAMLASEHNLFFLADLMTKIRRSITCDNFSQLKKQFFSRYYKK